VLAATQMPRTTGMTWGQERGAVAATFRSIFTVTAEHGLHLRPAASLVKVAARFDCQIKIECNGSVADAKSVMSVMMLEAMLQDELTVIAEGCDATGAMVAIEELLVMEIGEPASDIELSHEIRSEIPGQPNEGFATRFTAASVVAG
jgi:phosphotransferase system HPr (HPr) family protein